MLIQADEFLESHEKGHPVIVLRFNQIEFISGSQDPHNQAQYPRKLNSFQANNKTASTNNRRVHMTPWHIYLQFAVSIK